MKEHSTAELVTKKVVVNFLDETSKRYDWRYEASFKMKFNRRELKAIYWIGTINLSEVTEGVYNYPLYFRHRSGLLEKDGEWNRDVDGVGIGGTRDYLFDMRELMKEMLSAKSKGHLFYHFYIEETVRGDGEHRVSVLYTRVKGFGIIYGKGSELPWSEMPVKKFLHLTRYVVDEEVERIQILYNKWYNWMK